MALLPTVVAARDDRRHPDGMTDHSGPLAVMVATTAFVIAGVLAGLAGRRWAARLRRGAVFRPPWCELTAGVLSGILGWRVVHGALPVWWVSVPLCLCWLGVPLAAIDLAHRRLPDALTLPAYPILGCCLAVAAWHGPSTGMGIWAVAGAVVFGGVHAATHLIRPATLGAGDVKLAGCLGGVLGAVGWPAVLVGAVVAALITWLLAALTMARGAASARPWSAPYGPGLLVATWLVAAFPGTPVAGIGLPPAT